MPSENMLQALTPEANGSGSAIPSFAFHPSNPWTAAFQDGLGRAGLSGRRVYEVGVGAGANVAFMLQHCAASIVWGSDLDARLPLLAQKLLGEGASELLDRFRPIKGSVNLIDSPAARAEVAAADFVVGCLPQVPDPDDAMYTAFHLAQLKRAANAGERADDHCAHYYPWTAFNDYPFNSVGLGLNEALLRKVRSYAPHAQVILTFGCRVGKNILPQLFTANGYVPTELASRVVRQDERTSIAFFVALEAAMRGTGHEKDFMCEFYTDPHGKVLISASEAQDILISDPERPIYHEICVMLGRPAQASASPSALN